MSVDNKVKAFIMISFATCAAYVLMYPSMYVTYNEIMAHMFHDLHAYCVCVCVLYTLLCLLFRHHMKRAKPSSANRRLVEKGGGDSTAVLEKHRDEYDEELDYDEQSKQGQ